jgi:cobalt-zinc-cadmium efflux system protein
MPFVLKFGPVIWITTTYSNARGIKSMAHDHGHHHHHFEENDKPDNIVFAFWLNTAFAILEIAGGIYTNSVAILSDAVHDLGDSLSLGLAYFFHVKSRKKRDDTYSYGYRRFSLLGAFINSLILTLSSAFIIQESVTRLFEPEQPDTKGMIILAVIGIAVNTVAMLRLKKGRSINEKVISLHFLEDILGWIAVLVGSVVMTFADIPVLDPLLSIAIAGFILFNVYKNVRATFRIFLQGNPENTNQEEIHKKIAAVKGVKNIHDFHLWTMDGNYNVVTLHVVTEENLTLDQMEAIKKEVRHCLQHLNIQHITIEVEPEGYACDLSEC